MPEAQVARAFEHLNGLLLWPAVVLHGIVALWLVWSLRGAPS